MPMFVKVEVSGQLSVVGLGSDMCQYRPRQHRHRGRKLASGGELTYGVYDNDHRQCDDRMRA